jgi:hypothetical protein
MRQKELSPFPMKDARVRFKNPLGMLRPSPN